MIEETKGNGVTGLIPDFFHDVIAYLIPGYTVICLLVINVYISTHEFPVKIESLGITAFFFSSVLAYVIGRVLEQFGYKFIHHKKFPFFGDSRIVTSPKWGLLFDDENHLYTQSFKNNVSHKIQKWLEKQDGEALIEECKENKKDDYFNLIQFYLRERFPLVALYEKKQNANIVLTRSLACAFFLNIACYFIYLFLAVPHTEIVFSPKATAWVIINLVFSMILYSRFKQDKTYHAMYIFETFIAMKKLLKDKA